VSPPTDASDANRSDGPSVVPTDGAPSSDARDESPSVVALYGAFMPDAG
jgi:hypothetical protein